MGKPLTIPQQLEEIVGNMCRDYCKWPIAYRLDYSDPDQANEHMLDEKCLDCPLNRLI